MVILEDKRLLIVTGKGGVGKTTVCAALAVALASSGKRVLVAMCNAKERLSTMWGCDPIGSEVIEVLPSVWAVNMDPATVLEEYGSLNLKSRTLSKVLFDNRYVKAFFRAVPGLQDWSLLGKVWWHTTEQRDNGTRKYDVVILDAPATGHGLDMLRVPKVILDIAPPGILRRDAELAVSLLRDTARCAVVLVTLPEELPITETLELALALSGEFQIPIGHVVVNQAFTPLFSADEQAALSNFHPRGATDAGSQALAVGQQRAERERVQAESLARLTGGLTETFTLLPQLFEDASNPTAIDQLANRLRVQPAS